MVEESVVEVAAAAGVVSRTPGVAAAEVRLLVGCTKTDWK